MSWMSYKSHNRLQIYQIDIYKVRLSTHDSNPWFEMYDDLTGDYRTWHLHRVRFYNV